MSKYGRIVLTTDIDWQVDGAQHRLLYSFCCKGARNGLEGGTWVLRMVDSWAGAGGGPADSTLWAHSALCTPSKH